MTAYAGKTIGVRESAADSSGSINMSVSEGAIGSGCATNKRSGMRADEREASRTSSMSPRKVAFYGLFGQKNWGNECTLQAIIHNVRRYLPDAELRCICTDPDDTSKRYNIPSFPIANRYARGYPKEPGRQRSALVRVLQKVLLGVPRELLSWGRAFQSLRGFDLLIVPGTGLLTDFTSNPMGIPYRLFKWALIAKLCRCKLLFVSVGAGPTEHPMTRWFIKAALTLAGYRSYRDDYSKEFLEGIGFRTNRDRLYPDLAFSLPLEMFPEGPGRGRQKTVIGVGVKDYYGKQGQPERGGEAKYRTFIKKLGSFVTWLLENGYTVRLLIGDSLYDDRVKQDLIELLPSQPANERWDLINEPISSVADVLSALASTDLVVSARYHNILLALMLNKPVISLSYHDKFASLVAGVGMAEYCHDIDELDVDALTRHVTQLETQAGEVKPRIRKKVEEYRHALDEQYARIFS
jgi:polysaccharide pyruvyl transferase WcaK-like protein